MELFAFLDKSVPPETAPVLEFCARVVLVEKPRYREPRWSTLLPPDVCEFRSSAMRHALAAERRAFGSTFCGWNVSNWRRTEATCWSSTTSPSICLARSRAATVRSPRGGTTGADSGSRGASPHVIAA